MYVIIAEGLHDADYVAQYTVGFAALAERVQALPPERAAEITGIPAAYSSTGENTPPPNLQFGQLWNAASLWRRHGRARSPVCLL